MFPPEAPFDEPWQAQVFGLTVALSQAGVFDWPDWTRTLGAHLARGTDYWDAWLQALESMLAQRAIAMPEDIRRLAQAWQDAAHATPHGTPIRLPDGA